MNLGTRLGVLISALFALLLAVGTVLVIHNARQAVYDEVRSTSNLAAKLLEIAVATSVAGPPDSLRSRLLAHLGQVERARHLRIAILSADADPASARLDTPPVPARDSSAPGWFASLVAPEPFEFRTSLPANAMPHTEIVVIADPADEITEVWQGTRSMLAVLVLFTVFAIGAVNWISRRSLLPLQRVQAALDGVEHGDYRARLPEFDLPELRALAEKFNLMASALQQQSEQNRVLTERSLAIQEEERRHLARELHDELGQSITAMKALATSLKALPEDGGATLRERSDMIVSVCNQTYDVVRSMMRRLRPATLDEFGLVKALEQLVDDWNARHEDTFCRFTAPRDLPPLDDALGITFYRVTQECLTNVAKHAQASEVEIRLERRSGQARDRHEVLALEIRDDGVGFDPGKDSRHEGLGILGIRERIAALDGSVSLEARSGEGVRLAVAVPCARGAAAADTVAGHREAG